MTVAPGTQLGPYEILLPLGAGGMGEVYKARDPRLDRFTAIKILPPHIAKREELRQRFEREARAVASLNHPHICVLYDIGQHEDSTYMVMEFMEGETLEARLERGALPLELALKYAQQIADALDRAHRAGVTHRDIKPGNIMLTRDGVKVLDFGLAKSTSKPGPMDATLVATLTTEGTVLGTPQYMAPEQFEGKEADARSDIWAFGGVLYEMVAGQKAFQGKSYSSLVGAILSADPAPMAVQPFTPQWLEKLVRRCLAKDPEDRYQSMRDIVLDLRTPAVETTRQASQKPDRRPWILAAAASVVALAACAFAAFQLSRPAAQPLATITEISAPESAPFASIRSMAGATLSPDGRTLAFVALTANGPLLHLRALDSLTARPIPGTEGAGRPFWSPDSKSIAFAALGRLKRVDLPGGTPVDLCDARFARGGTWNQDGVILFGDQRKVIQRIPASGGTPVPATIFNTQLGESSHYYPQFLPNGKDFLYLIRHDDSQKMGLYLGSLDKPTVPGQRLVETQYKALYDPASASLLYMPAPGVLVARRLELHPFRFSGDPIPIAESVSVASNNGYADFSLSHGALLYGSRDGAQKSRFAWRDNNGKLIEVAGPSMELGFGFDLSPDDSRVAYVAPAGAQSYIAIFDLKRGISTRLTFRFTSGPLWSPDGRHVIYVSEEGIRRKAADGSGEEELLVKGTRQTLPASVSPDGKVLAYGVERTLLVPLTGDRTPQPLLEGKHSVGMAKFSPDGRWVAYQSDESGRYEVYIQGFPDRRGRWQISTNGGSGPVFSRDGKQLFYQAIDNYLMAVPLDMQANAVIAGPPRRLFRLATEGFAQYRGSRDGKRILALEPEGAAGNRVLMLVQNWAARLNK